MKAIILAAGMGSRLSKYTKTQPKCMLPFNGKTLIEWQIERLKKAGISEIIVVTGYKRECINLSNVRYYHNEKFASTNMVESLLCARREMDTDILVTYSDILFDLALVRQVSQSLYAVSVAVDSAWRKYWKLRYGTTETDLESLTVSENGKIIEIGKPVERSVGLKYRYIGLIKFSRNAIHDLLKFYDKKKNENEKWIQSQQPFLQGYMTDLLDELITSGLDVRADIFKNGWVEFDTADDYERICHLHHQGKLSQLISL